ncbi:MAG: hypothetical protein WC994_00240 [Brumimicrobium sp.]
MKNITFILLLVMFTSCKETKLIEFNGDTYMCEVKIYNNKMPSPTPAANSIYAVVILRAKDSKLTEAWQLKFFKLNKDRYSEFEIEGFSGKDGLLYQNVVRNIKESEQYNAVIHFENEKGKTLKYKLNDLDILVVH